MIKFKKTFDRSISGSIWKQLLWLIFFLVIIFLFWLFLSYLLYNNLINSSDTNELGNPLNSAMNNRVWAIISHLFDPGNIHMASPQIRIFALLIAFSGSVVLSGLLISTFSNSMERRIDKIKLGQINYSFKNHYIIIGYNNMVTALIKQLAYKENNNKLDIVLHTSQYVPEVKRKLKSRLPNSIENKVTILQGGRDTQEEMDRLKINNAKEIFIMGEGEEMINDSLNIECLNHISKIIQQKNTKQKTVKKIRCHVLFHSQTTFSAFQFLDLPTNISANIELIPYNFFELWARQVLVFNQTTDFSSPERHIKYKPLDYSPINEDSPLSVHLIITGFNEMGLAMTIESIRLAHFANGEKTRITIIDKDAETGKNFFKTKYPHYDKITDIELSFIPGDLETNEIQKKLITWVKEENALTTIAICFEDPGKCLNAALNLPFEIYTRNIPILVRQEISYTIISLLKLKDNGFNKLKNVVPFGMTDLCFNIDSDRDIKAKALNYFYWNKLEINEKIEISELEKFWDKISLSDKWSNRYNADSFDFKLRALNKLSETTDYPIRSFTNSEIETLAKMEHARWNAERILAGFRPPGKNEIEKSKQMNDEEYEKYKKELRSKMVHLCIIPYEELREKYKKFDRKLIEIIPLLENKYGIKTEQKIQNSEN